jgi:hypothetical protein
MHGSVSVDAYCWRQGLISWEGSPQVYQTSLLLSIYQVESHTKSLHMYIVVVVGKFACSNKVVCQISSESGFPCLTHQKWEVQGRKVLLLWLFGFLLEIQMTRRRAVVEGMTPWLYSMRHFSCMKDITIDSTLQFRLRGMRNIRTHTQAF